MADLPVLAPRLLHALFEALGYAVGIRLFLASRRTVPTPLRDRSDHWVAVGAVLGAAVFSKVLFWLQYPGITLGALPDVRALLPGKTIVGGFLGGVAGVELAKRRLGILASTGDAFTRPLIAGMAIGRLGCLLLGAQDGTAGSPTGLPWGVDYGDGVARHPAALYEIVFLLGLRGALARLPAAWLRPGDSFRLFMIFYLGFRFLADFGKPPFGEASETPLPIPLPHLYGGVLTAIQLACLAGVGYHLLSWSRAARTPPNDA